MAPSSWTTNEQFEFLQSWSTLYEEHHAKHSYETFWPKVYEAWFARWPIQEVPIDPALMTAEDNAQMGADLKKKRSVSARALEFGKETDLRIVGNKIVVSQSLEVQIWMWEFLYYQQTYSQAPV